MRSAVLPEQQHHGPRPELFVPRAAAVVFAAADLRTSREDLRLFTERVGLYIIGLQILRRFEFFCWIIRYPFAFDAICEEGHQRLAFHLPGDRADLARPPKVFERIWIFERIQPDDAPAFAKGQKQSKTCRVLPECPTLHITAVSPVGFHYALARQESLDRIRNRSLSGRCI